MGAIPGLQILLFGGFRLIYDGILITTFTQARSQALLAYLLLHRHSPQPRQLLSFLFWPDSKESQARTNLRQLIHHIQKALPAADRYLIIEPTTLQWRLEGVFSFDVADFELDINQAELSKQIGQFTAVRRMLESAVKRYQGDLLPGCYDDWIFPERERLRQMYFSTLEQLIKHLEEQHDYRAAIIFTEALLRHDPLRETTYQQLMRLHRLNGDRAKALRVYHACATILKRELGVEPNLEIQEAYQHLVNVQAPKVVKRRQQSSTTAGPAFIGRQHEWSVLQTAWKHASDGHPGLVLITGEAGIGKTRLAEEFVGLASQQGISTAKTRSYSAEGQLAYTPVTLLLRSEPYHTGLSGLDPVWLIELVHLMPELLAEKQDLIGPEPITSDRQRNHLFEALARAIFMVKEPLLLLFDDLQWCDRDTLEWLHYLLHFSEGARLLIIGVVRSEEVDETHPLEALVLDLRNREQLTEIEVGPLNKNDTSVLAEQVAGMQIDPEAAARLYYQSEGNPLFVVEMVRAELNQSSEEMAIGVGEKSHPDTNLVQALGQRQHSTANLPTRVQAVIQARLRQLSPTTRELASLAAAIGREFSVDLISLASDMDDEALVQGLDELWRRRIVREQGGPYYDFSHDRIREVAYIETSAARRGLLHRRVAKALEQLHAANLDGVSSQIAAHYEQAGSGEQAVGYYQRAAKVAQRTFSNAEVIHLLESGLSLLPLLPDTQEKRQTELDILISLGTTYMLSMGYAHPNVERTLLRAWNVILTMEKSTHTIPVLAGLWLCYHVRGDMPQQILWAEKLQPELQNGQDENFLPVIYFVLTGTAYFRGEFIAANQYGERGYGLFEAQKRGPQSLLFSYEPAMALKAYWAWDLWTLGYPDQARLRMQEALSEAKSSDHPGNTVLGMCQDLILHIMCGEVSAVLEQAGEIINFATEAMIPYWVALVQIFQGWALVHAGNIERGLEEQRQGLATWQAMGAGMGLTLYMLLMAESCTVGSRFDEGLEAVEKALAIVRSGNECCFEAELYRRQGELLLAKGGNSLEAEACFQQALGSARRQQARSYELRAATSLSHLWGQQGRKAEAYPLLADVYNWFTEGYDTPDLQHAQALLKSLA